MITISNQTQSSQIQWLSANICIGPACMRNRNIFILNYFFFCIHIAWRSWSPFGPAICGLFFERTTEVVRLSCYTSWSKNYGFFQCIRFSFAKTFYGACLASYHQPGSSLASLSIKNKPKKNKIKPQTFVV